MGRGTRHTSSASASALRAGLATPVDSISLTLDQLTKIKSSEIDHEVPVGDTGDFVRVTGDAPLSLIDGITQVSGVSRQSPGRYVVSFSDGVKAMVLVGEDGSLSLSLSDGSTDDMGRIQGALGFALARHHEGAFEDERWARLADAFEDITDLPQDPQAIAAFAAAVQGGLSGRVGEVTVNPLSLRPWLNSRMRSPEAPVKELSPRALARARVHSMRTKMEEARQRGFSQAAALRAFVQGRTLEDDLEQGIVTQKNLTGLTPDKFMERQMGAVALGSKLVPYFEQGKPVYAVDENNNIVIGDDGEPVVTQRASGIPNVLNSMEIAEREMNLINDMETHEQLGTRTFFLAGPPGTGKTMMAKAWAELKHMQYSEFTLGEGVSLQALLGDTGMKTEYIYDKDGNKIGGVPTTVEQEGKLLRAMKQPGVVCINEAEDIQEMVLAMNTALGDRVGATDSRTINTNTSEGEDVSHLVHPDCHIVFTWNPGLDNKGPAESSLDRGLMCYLQRGTPREEMPRYKKMMEEALRFQDRYPELHDWEVPEDFALSVANVAQKLQNAAATDPGTYTREVGARVMAKLGASIIMAGVEPENVSENPVHIAMRQLHSLMPGEMDRSVANARGKVTNEASSALTALTSEDFVSLKDGAVAASNYIIDKQEGGV